mmetsp:Transcript_11262/g.15713  ORF Transcript_11262/g.15713 Transcript_11262/m.15713 type:complete len:206 (-) Transcript_11262:591-1208(-)
MGSVSAFTALAGHLEEEQGLPSPTLGTFIKLLHLPHCMIPLFGGTTSTVEQPGHRIFEGWDGTSPACKMESVPPFSFIIASAAFGKDDPEPCVSMLGRSDGGAGKGWGGVGMIPVAICALLSLSARFFCSELLLLSLLPSSEQAWFVAMQRLHCDSPLSFTHLRFFALQLRHAEDVGAPWDSIELDNSGPPRLEFLLFSSLVLLS